MNPFAFVVGCPRSGTTLVRRMLEAHPDIAFPAHETHWIPECFYQRTGVSPDGFVTGELVDVLVGNPRYITFGMDPDEIERLIGSRDHLHYAEFVTTLFDSLAREYGRPLAADKTPGYVLEIELMHELWPWTRFVHVIRDGRDVCLSATNWQRKQERLVRRFPTWSRDAVTTAALWWKLHVLSGVHQGRKLGVDLYHELRYESLVERPEETCRELSGFLTVAFTPRMLRFHEGRTRRDPGLSAKHAWLPVMPGLRDWRTQMGAPDLRRFEAAAGDLLDMLGYERSGESLSRADIDHAARLEEQFIAGLPSRMRELAEAA